VSQELKWKIISFLAEYIHAKITSCKRETYQHKAKNFYLYWMMNAKSKITVTTEKYSWLPCFYKQTESSSNHPTKVEWLLLWGYAVYPHRPWNKFCKDPESNDQRHI